MSTDLVAPTRIWRQAKSLVRSLSDRSLADRSLAVRSSKTRGPNQETGLWSTLLQTEQSRKARDSFGEQCNEIFTLVLAIEGAHAAPTPEEIDLKLAPHFREMERIGGQVGLSDVDLAHVQYALVALIDEAVLHSGIQNRSEWESRPLQFVRYGDRGAGEEFFRRLDAVRRGSRRKEVLSVFFLCLALGFEGKYRLGSRDELITLRRMLSQDLHGDGALRPSELYINGTRRVPKVSRWAMTPGKTATGLLVLLTGLYGGLRVDLRQRVARTFSPASAAGERAEDDLNPLAAIFSSKRGNGEKAKQKADQTETKDGSDKTRPRTIGSDNLMVEAPVIHSYIGATTGGRNTRTGARESSKVANGHIDDASVRKADSKLGAIEPATSLPPKRIVPPGKRGTLSPVMPVSDRKAGGIVKPSAEAETPAKAEQAEKATASARESAAKPQPMGRAENPAPLAKPAPVTKPQTKAQDDAKERAPADMASDDDGDPTEERFESWR